MEPTHVHLLLNHYPIFATFIGSAILFLGLKLNNKTAKVISYSIFISAALVSIIVFQSGGGAEHIIEKLIPSSDDYIEAHEDVAKIALWFAIIVGMISIFGIYASFKKKQIEKNIGIAILIASIISIGFFAYVGSLGGKIVHTELRDSAPITKSSE